MLVPRAPFSLDESFIDQYRGTQPQWGPVGYLVNARTYALEKPDGSMEEFWETCRRVVEGVYQIQKGHCLQLNLPWSDSKAQRSAQEMFASMYAFKWLPPGRGLSKMGTEVMFRVGGACLNNCGMISTRNIGNKNIKNAFSAPFTWLMSMSMVGVGVGFDTRGAGTVKLIKPTKTEKFVVEDSREGWCEYLRQLLESLVDPSQPLPIADYSKVRPKGAKIHGFGGTASGPEALELLTQRILKLSKMYGDSYVDSRFIVDVANSVGECVVSGGVRRTAEIAFGHEDDEQFLRFKDFANNPEASEWPRWASNNSFIVNENTNFEKLAAFTAMNGEPGYLFLDNARKYGRMMDPPNYKDQRAVGSNPCVTGDTLIFTAEGPRTALSLLGKPFTAVVDNKQYSSSNAGVFKTGTRPVYLLETVEGHAVKVTGNHLILTAPKLTVKKRYEEWKEAQDLAPDDLIILNDTSEAAWPGYGTFGEGWLMGSLLGDGSIQKDFAKLEYCGDARQAMLQVALGYIRDIDESTRHAASRTGNDTGAVERSSTTSVALLHHAREVGLVYEDGQKQFVSEAVLRTSSEFHKGFLRGLFDADGSVQGSQSKGVSIRLGSVNRQHLRIAQQMLLNLGINSSIYQDRREAGNRDLPGGNYDCHSAHELVIANANVLRFADVVGFHESKKTAKLASLISECKRNANRERYVARVKSLTYLGVEDVYDCTIHEVHRFGANNITVHNCAEQTLEDYELCCLVETFPSNCASYEEYERTLKYAYLYAKTVTLVPTQSAETNAVMLRNRRIGCSQSGIQDNIAKVGLRTHLQWCDQGYRYIQKLDEIYSDWLCIPRSIKTTSVKPSGTISKLVGVREGIHESKGEYEFQTIRLTDGSPLLKVLEDANYRIEQDVKAPNTKVVYFPMHYPQSRKRPQTMWEQLELAALMQHYWADNQVSVTVDFDKKTEGPEIALALQMYAHRLKGLSFLPREDHGYEQAPKQVITKEEYEAYKAQLKPLDFSKLQSIHEADDKFCDGGLCEIPAPPKS